MGLIGLKWKERAWVALVTKPLRTMPESEDRGNFYQRAAGRRGRPIAGKKKDPGGRPGSGGKDAEVKRMVGWSDDARARVPGFAANALPGGTGRSRKKFESRQPQAPGRKRVTPITDRNDGRT
jgi:hypothetical protein